VTDAYRALGQLLAQHRQGAGLTQAGLAGLVPWSRSTIASVERGQAAAAEFWKDCDDAVNAGGALLTVAQQAIDLSRGYRAAAKAAAKQTGLDADRRVLQSGRSLPLSADVDRPAGLPVLNVTVPAGAIVTIALEGDGTTEQSWRVVVSAAERVDGVEKAPIAADGVARLYSIDARRELGLRDRGDH
jgi:transcriptional regulator with XRE-family HTH domain